MMFSIQIIFDLKRFKDIVRHDIHKEAKKILRYWSIPNEWNWVLFKLF